VGTAPALDRRRERGPGLHPGDRPAVRADRTWANLYDLRNHLAHSRLPDIDESLVRRFTWTRLDALHATQHHLQTGP
jgi:hypothetical protein